MNGALNDNGHFLSLERNHDHNDHHQGRVTYFHTGPEGPELKGLHKGIQRVCASSTPKEETPTADLRVAKRGRKAGAN